MTQTQGFFQVDWANGNTDIFADEVDALQTYAGQPELQRTVEENGFYTDTPDEMPQAEWSPAAEAARVV